MSIKVDDVLECIDRAKNGEPLSVQDLNMIEQAVTLLNDQVVEYQRIAQNDEKFMRKATLAFKRAKGWPSQLMPSLGDVIEWLMERSHVHNNLFYQEVLQESLTKFDVLGPLSFGKKHEVEDTWLLDLRTKIFNALAKTRPAGAENRANG